MPQISQTIINDRYVPYAATAPSAKNYTDKKNTDTQSVSLSLNTQTAKQARTITLSDTIETNDDGIVRRTRVFEQEDGRRFSKLEEITFTQNGVRKIITQQNPSGSITQYEEVLDKQSDGLFRRTQRLTDGAGETSTQITPDYIPRDAFILSGGQTGFVDAASPFQDLRGTQLDLTA